MAKRKPRRSRGIYIKGNVNETLSLGTLASVTALGADFDEVLAESARISSVQGVYSLEGFTPVAGDGPIEVGIAHGDYSATEIAEFITTTGSWDRGNKTEQEVANRLIRKIGVFDTPQAVEDAVVLNDGKPIKTKLNWNLNTGQTLQVWAFNHGTDALTTGSAVRLQGHANIWQK